MEPAGRATAVEIVLALAGFGFLVAAGIASGLGDNAAPWLTATLVAWACAALLEIQTRRAGD